MSPDLIDAHHHLWDPATRTYPWMGGGSEALRRRFDLDDLRAVTTAAGIVRTVLVQTVAQTSETVNFLRVAAGSDGLVAGVVGWLDLTASDVPAAIARLRAGSGGRLLVGIRHQVEDEPSGWLAQPQVRTGLAAVAAADLVYDLLVRPDQLAEAAAAVAATPGGRFVLDHGAKPPIGRSGWDEWARGLRILAEHPAVSVKLSGLATEVPPHAPLTDLLPSALTMLDAFGPGRTMFGSDWPVCTVAGSYQQVVGLARQALTDLDASERQAVLGGTAAEIYALGVATPAGPRHPTSGEEP